MQTLNTNKIGQKLQASVIFNTLRILKGINPGDTYYEAYKGHYDRDGDDFYDLYMFLWELGSNFPPKRVLEIGTRTGISLCQLLSAYYNLDELEKVVCVDPFNDGYISSNLVKKNLRMLNLPVDKVKFMEMTSNEAFDILDIEGETFDYILVDGDHSKPQAMKDLENAHGLIEHDGIIVFDDLSPYGCNLLDVWSDWKGQHLGDYDFEERMAGKGLGWAKRR